MPKLGLYFPGSQEHANESRALLGQVAESLDLGLGEMLDKLARGELVIGPLPVGDAEKVEGDLFKVLEQSVAALRVSGYRGLADELERRRQALLEVLR